MKKSWKNKFDLVHISSVFHHVPPENLYELCREISQVIKLDKYLIVKDSCTVTDAQKAEHIIQHEIFEGVFVPSIVPHDK
jgi:cyclopropane fatty-acyl-phospholipid synthase-like methyltransferase